MSALAIDHRQRIEHVVDQVLAAIQSRYPLITTEIVYNPPDEGDAWIILQDIEILIRSMKSTSVGATFGPPL